MTTQNHRGNCPRLGSYTHLLEFASAFLYSKRILHGKLQYFSHRFHYPPVFDGMRIADGRVSFRQRNLPQTVSNPGELWMKKRYYRVWLAVEEVDGPGDFEPKLVEQVELAAFQTLEEALTYRYELSQKYSPKVTGESEVIGQMTSPETLTAGD